MSYSSDESPLSDGRNLDIDQPQTNRQNPFNLDFSFFPFFALNGKFISKKKQSLKMSAMFQVKNGSEPEVLTMFTVEKC
jgi:hypothetical protein